MATRDDTVDIESDSRTSERLQRGVSSGEEVCKSVGVSVCVMLFTFQ